MDVFDYAMQLEKDGENYYREGAARSANKGMKKIMTILADAEVKHYDLFKQMKEHKPFSLPEATILKDVKNIFVSMREEKGSESIDASEVDFYRKAQDIEKQTENFYLEKASQAEDTAQKEAFVQIAKEENKHYFILDRIIEFVSRPEQWLENAEFYHLDEY
jgi:rubrerythrin